VPVRVAATALSFVLAVAIPVAAADDPADDTSVTLAGVVVGTGAGPLTSRRGSSSPPLPVVANASRGSTEPVFVLTDPLV